jgi:hypothetical protein
VTGLERNSTGSISLYLENPARLTSRAGDSTRAALRSFKLPLQESNRVGKNLVNTAAGSRADTADRWIGLNWADLSCKVSEGVCRGNANEGFKDIIRVEKGGCCDVGEGRSDL